MKKNIELDLKEKKRLSFEMIYEQKRGVIDHLNIDELEEYRQRLIGWLDSVGIMTKEDGIKESRKQYLIGLRNCVIRPLLSDTKKRKATLNRVVHNGAGRDFAIRFIEVAAKKLPLEQFQLIYGAALSKVDIENQTIDDVKDFMKQAHKVLER